MTLDAGPAVSPETLEAGRAAGLLHFVEQDGVGLRRFVQDVRDAPRGTVLLGDDGGEPPPRAQVVPAFPPIGRILALEAGLAKNFTGPVRAEEKIDGYNVRIVRWQDRLLPLTRGGFVCPFTADRLPGLCDLEALFDAHPDLVLCCEVTGRGNPYILSPSSRGRAPLALFAFDLMRLGQRGFVPPDERDHVLERFAVPRAPVRARALDPRDVAGARELALRLDREGAEGLVFKPAVGDGPRVKYITPRTNVTDIVTDAHLLAELPPHFFVLRLIRLAIGLGELGTDEARDELERTIGGAFATAFADVVESVRRGGGVTERYEVELSSDAACDRVLAHISGASKKIEVREIGDRFRRGPLTVMTIEKLYRASTDKLRTLLGGSYVLD